MTTKVETNDLFERYKSARTLQDLIDLGVKPKTSSQAVQLLTLARLKGLRELVESELTELTLGKWIPAIDIEGKRLGQKEIVNSHDILPGMHIRVAQNDSQYQGLDATVVATYQSADKFDVKVQRPGGFAPEIITLPIKQFTIDATQGNYFFAEINKLTLNPNVTAAKDRGHMVTLMNLPKDNKINAALAARPDDWFTVKFPEGLTGTLIDYKQAGGKGLQSLLYINFDQRVPEINAQNLVFQAGDVWRYLRASSLGQEAPKDRATAVRDEMYNRFFPKVVIPHKRIHRVLIALLMGLADIGFYGPQGWGKSKIANEIINLARKQQLYFTVEGCQVNCNPFSLIKSEFAQEHPACQCCKDRYSNDDYSRSGHYKPVDPKEVRIEVKAMDYGTNVALVQGGVGLQPMNLTGYKIPDFSDPGMGRLVKLLDAHLNGGASTAKPLEGSAERESREPSTKSDQTSMKGYIPGKLTQANSGILLFEEMDKVRDPVLDALLLAISDNMSQPDQLRYPVPSNFLGLCTMNDHSRLSGPLNDRIMLLAMRPPSDQRVLERIMRKSYHRQYTTAETISMPDVHVLDAPNPLDIIMPITYEHAVAGFYHWFYEEFQHEMKRDVQSSPRSMQDALGAARANLLLERAIGLTSSEIVQEGHVKFGIQLAMCTRVNFAKRTDEAGYKQVIVDKIGEKWPELLMASENVFWCNAKRYMAVAQARNATLGENLIQEWQQYSETPARAYSVLKAVRDTRSTGYLTASAKHVFMDFLFDNQPQIDRINTPAQATELIAYFVTSAAKSPVKFPF